MKNRRTYQRSGRVSWLQFLPAAIATMAVAAGMSYCWDQARRADLGFWIVTPAILALPVAIAAYLAVAIGRCRNRVIAGVLGVVAAAVFCLGAWYADFVRAQGPQAIGQFDLLAEFIGDRIARDGGIGPGGFLPRNGHFNWIYAAVEWSIVIVIVAGLAIYRSNRGYCESCGRWMRAIALRVDRGIGDEITEALQHRDWRAIPVTVGRGPFASNCDWLDFEYCPGVSEPGRECAAYLTIKEQPGNPLEHPRVLMRQRRLDDDEIDALARRVNALAFLRVSAPAAAEGQQSVSRMLQGPGGSVAAIERLPDSAGGAGLARSGKIEFMCGLSVVLAALLGIGMVVLGAIRTDWSDPLGSVLDVIVFALGIVLTIAAGAVAFVNVDYPGMRYAHRWICGVIAERPDPLVVANNPNAYFVDVVPRAQWHQVIPDKAADRGLLLLDRERGRLLFEGAKERYVIPVDAVLSSKVVPMLPHTGSWNFYAVVLTVRYPEDAPSSVTGGRRNDKWEIPILPRPTKFRRYSTAHRRELADGLLADIELFLDEARSNSARERE